jgi:hypothetical protein
MHRVRTHQLGIAAVFVATLALSALVRHFEWPQATPQDVSHAQASTTTSTPPSMEPAAPARPAVPSSEAEPQAAPSANITTASAPPEVTTPAATTAPAGQDLAGTWRGEYVNASGKELLRVVSLSISRVADDGGIEGTLQYQAASGNGECRLHPRGSTYSAVEQRLQLSPEGCSPRYPRELGVPLDFDGVNPWANALKDGRIEAPNGEVIRVRLMRVSGA